jgi:hypothetical protein
LAVSPRGEVLKKKFWPFLREEKSSKKIFGRFSARRCPQKKILGVSPRGDVLKKKILGVSPRGEVLKKKFWAFLLEEMTPKKIFGRFSRDLRESPTGNCSPAGLSFYK